MDKKGHSHLTKAERHKAVDSAERAKYDRTHKKAGARKGNARGGKMRGARLAFDALKKKK